MNVKEIIKDAFLFPSRNTGRFAIYLLLSILMVSFACGGILTIALGIIDDFNYFLGGIYIIISMLIGFIIADYHISIIKSGIEHNDEIPTFSLFKNCMEGFINIIVILTYILIPTLIVILIGHSTNLLANAYAVIWEFISQMFNVYIMGNSIDIAVNAISNALVNFVISFTVTFIIALVLFAIFSILLSIAEARLASTGSLKEALNIIESIKDIKRIGVVKSLAVLISVGLIIALIEIILIILIAYYPFLFTIICIILTLYLALVAQRAIGLLYSDIS